MDINTINEAIQTLEEDDTTANNVSELANLYIVRENMEQGLNSMVMGPSSDILPTYNKYKLIKAQYQTGKISEEPVITGINTVCSELCDLITTIYSGTDMYKERRCICKMLEKLYKKYVEKP